jgi:hypothetical protein
MPLSNWTEDHVTFLEGLVRQGNLTSRDMATQMSRHFHVRVTPAHVNTLMHRMRTPSDPFYRGIPYRRRGARFAL